MRWKTATVSIRPSDEERAAMQWETKEDCEAWLRALVETALSNVRRQIASDRLAAAERELAAAEQAARDLGVQPVRATLADEAGE